MLWDGQSGPDLIWQASVSVPFAYAASKNHIYAMRRSGHVALRRESRALRDLITQRIKLALANQRVAHNKLWIDILVQKPDHRGDAVNVVDLVCDAIKAAVPVDDRWFCIRRLDWEIAKDDPRMFLKVGQETEEDCQVCSFCGQIRPFGDFTKRKNSRLGIDRVCRHCRRHGRKLAKGERTAPHLTLGTEPIPVAKPRTCLKCGKTFDSSGPGNRICSPCQRANARVVLDNSELDKQRGAKRHNGRIMPLDLEALS